MGKKKYLAGEMVSYDKPNWAPLAEAGEDWVLGGFMAMHQVRLETGLTICAYKHTDTRCYVHLGENRQAYEYIWGGPHDGKYRAVPSWEAFDRAIRDQDFLHGFEDRARMEARWDSEDEDEDWIPPSTPERGYPLNRFSRGLSDPWKQPDPPPEPARPRG